MNSVYVKVPLLDEHDDSENWAKTKSIDEIDVNGNQIYESFRKDVMEGDELGHLSETKIQLYPEIFTKSITHDDAAKFPKEKRKLFIAFLILVFGFISNCISIVLTHQKVPDHLPLPDIILDNITKRRWLNDVADILVIVCTILSALIVALHRHRWILCRRVFLILSLLYYLRSVTMYVTVLPLANNHVYCSPRINQSLSYGQTVLTITVEVVKLIHSGGLPITGKKTLCGDYIYSGHTIILMMAYLLVREYIPKRYNMIHWSSWSIAWIGMICLLVSHGHYTIDVIIGYYATTRMFWIYHTFSNNPELKVLGHCSKSFAFGKQNFGIYPTVMAVNNTTDVGCASTTEIQNALQSFRLFCPTEFVVADAVPAKNNCKPYCSWHISYQYANPGGEYHKDHKAKQEFKKLSRRIPPNVRLVKKSVIPGMDYYIIEYGVPCDCPKPNFSFPMTHLINGVMKSENIIKETKLSNSLQIHSKK